MPRHRLRQLRHRWVSSLLVVACTMNSAQAEPRATLADGAVGRIEFRSHTPASQRPLLTRAYLNEPAAVIGGMLSLPANTPLQREGKSPAVIIAHGIGGISAEREQAWAKRLNEWGIAAFVVDSFAGRGLKPPVYADSPKTTHFAAHLLDAYLALQLIATHPKIDGRRVAIMGFSRGGDVAMNAVFERFRTGALDSAPNKFAAYIPFYPYCNFRHVSKALAPAPMLMLLAGADEMNEPAPCERFAAWLKERDIPVKVIVYPNAHHGFDRLQPVTLDRAFAGIRKCEAEYNLDSLAIRRLDTGAPLTREAIGDWIRECRHKGGARFGGDAKAREASISEVRTFLSDVFGR
jgi:dienelactone hydrolase